MLFKSYQYLSIFVAFVCIPTSLSGQNSTPIAFGESLEYDLPEESSVEVFSTPYLNVGDVIFIKIASGGLKLDVELYEPGAATPVTTVNSDFNEDIELIYPVPQNGVQGVYTLIIANNGIWTGVDCLTLQRMNTPPTAVYLGCDTDVESGFLCRSSIRAFRYLVEESTVSRITIDGIFEPEAWICTPQGEVIEYASANFNEQLVITTMPAPATSCYYVFVSDDAALYVNDFSISYTTILGSCAGVVIESNQASDELCEGDDLVLTASSTLDDMTFTWTGPNGFTSSQAEIVINGITVEDAGQYEVTAVSPSVCTSSAARQIIVNPQPEVAAQSNPEDGSVCVGGNLGISVVTDAVFPITYAWAGPNNYSSVFNSNSIFNAELADSGTYTISVTDGRGCTNTDAVELVVHPDPVISITSPTDNQVCIGDDLVLNVITNTTLADYNWSGPNSFSSSAQSPLIEDAASIHQGTYRVTVTNSETGCSSIESAFINVRSVPNAVILGDTTVCEGAMTTITASGGTSYTWSTGETTDLITLAPISNTTVSVTVTNNFGCSDVAFTSLVIEDLPSLELSSTPTIPEICEGEGPILLCVTSNAQNPGYSWISEGFSSQDQCITLEDVTQSGTYLGMVTNGSTGCVNAMEIPVTIHPVPVIDILAVPDVRLCNEERLILCANSDATTPTFSWAGPSAFTSTERCPELDNLSASNSGSYAVTVTTDMGCSSVATVNIEVGTPLQCELANTDGGVEAAALGGFAPYTYILSPGGATNSTGVFTDLSAGTYTVEVIDDNECTCTTSNIVVNTDAVFEPNEVLIFPNPGTGLFNLLLSDPPKDKAQVSVRSMTGQLMKSFEINNQREVLDLSTVPSGTYFLNVENGRMVEVVKVVVVR